MFFICHSKEHTGVFLFLFILSQLLVSILSDLISYRYVYIFLYCTKNVYIQLKEITPDVKCFLKSVFMLKDGMKTRFDECPFVILGNFFNKNMNLLNSFVHY